MCKQFSLVSWQKILEEQRRLKREQEEADTASRRHTSIVPTHHQFITNERFGDLLNITDNTEKRKSGIEVQCTAVSYPCVSRKKDGRCFVTLWVRLWGEVSAGTDGFSTPGQKFMIEGKIWPVYHWNISHIHFDSSCRVDSVYQLYIQSGRACMLFRTLHTIASNWACPRGQVILSVANISFFPLLEYLYSERPVQIYS